MHVSCKTWNHPQTSQITHKPSELSTNQPNHPQTSQTMHKPPTNQTNHPQTSQIPKKSPSNQSKITLFFDRRHFLWTATFPLPIPCKKRNGCIFFDVPTRFCISPSPLHNSVTSLIADYNPSNKLLTQLQTLMNFQEG